MIVLHYGAGVRTLKMAGVTYDLRTLDPLTRKVLTKSVIGKVATKKGVRK